MKMAENNSGLRKSLLIMAKIAENRKGLSFTHLRRLCADMPSATLSRLLKVLIDEKWLDKDKHGHYYPGNVFMSSADIISGQSNRQQLIQKRIKMLAQDTCESAAFIEWNNEGYFTFRSKYEMPESYHYMEAGQSSNDIFNHGFALLGMAYCNYEQLQKLYIRHEMPEGEREKHRKYLQVLRQEKVIIKQDKGIRIAAAAVNSSNNLVGVVGISMLPRELSDSDKSFYFSQVKSAAEDIVSYF